MRPLSTQVSPSRVATVVSLCEFEPASGSVIPNAMIDEPLAIFGSQCCFCSSVPNLAMIVPQMAGDTTIISRPQPAAASSSQHDGQLVHAGPATAVLLRQVHADEAELGGLLPQLRESAAVTRLPHEELVAVLAGEVGHRRPQRLLLVGLGEVHSGSSSGLTTASTLPTSTCWPAATGSSATIPAAGAEMTCSIFIASSHSSGWPCVT